jgi:hypothetical protein
VKCNSSVVLLNISIPFGIPEPFENTGTFEIMDSKKRNLTDVRFDADITQTPI